jgi:probable HAF family extracellular repeat protein
VTKFFLPLVLAAGMHAATVQAQPKYSITAICKGDAMGINNNGDVCGSFPTVPNADGAIPHHAFLYKKGKITDLGVYVNPNGPGIFPAFYETAGTAVDNSDIVVGQIFDARNGDDLIDSFVDLSGKIVPIATGDDDGGFASSAAAINNSGWVVGSMGYASKPPVLTDSPTPRGFLYRNGTTYDLGTLGGYFSQAFDINNAGQIVGCSTAVVGGLETPWQAFLYQNGKMQAIGGHFSQYFVPAAINDNGWIAGTLYNHQVTFNIPDSGPGEVGFVPNGTAEIATVELYINGNWIITGTGTAVSMNNSGLVIGYNSTGLFIYGGGKTYDLNALIKGDWTITNVGHINDAGQIAATGIVKGSDGTVTYALLLNPTNSGLRP